MDLLKKELIFLRNGHIRIFRCKTRSLSTRPPNYAVQIRRGVNFCCNEQLLNFNYKITFDVIRRFLCNTKTNFNASNDEPLTDAVNTFQKYLRSELDATKLRLEQVKKWAIEKDGYVRLRIEDIDGDKIKFVLDRVIFANLK